jgi:hypothetical protein
LLKKGTTYIQQQPQLIRRLAQHGLVIGRYSKSKQEQSKKEGIVDVREGREDCVTHDREKIL